MKLNNQFSVYVCPALFNSFKLCTFLMLKLFATGSPSWLFQLFFVQLPHLQTLLLHSTLKCAANISEFLLISSYYCKLKKLLPHLECSVCFSHHLHLCSPPAPSIPLSPLLLSQLSIFPLHPEQLLTSLQSPLACQFMQDLFVSFYPLLISHQYSISPLKYFFITRFCLSLH